MNHTITAGVIFPEALGWEEKSAATVRGNRLWIWLANVPLLVYPLVTTGVK